MEAQIKKIIIDGLNEMNHLGWITFETQSLKRGLKVPDESNGPEFKDAMGSNHSLYDTIENLEVSIVNGLGLSYETCLKDKRVQDQEKYFLLLEIIEEIMDNLEFEISNDHGFTKLMIIK